ncbi:hypothetical protein AVEN_171848-1 [Araneus ventricosus]|uniref:Uncharacterized protein n=1 Tax=Araneus ventricosus TaxID=182803 RepID=A0A4Y2F591_ARAVE|nr:hypothetical protein AVEN_171848-1 [Araneus ventricosus]
MGPDPLNPFPNQGSKPKKDKVPGDMQEISPKLAVGPLTSNYTFHESQPPPTPEAPLGQHLHWKEWCFPEAFNLPRIQTRVLRRSRFRY